MEIPKRAIRDTTGRTTHRGTATCSQPRNPYSWPVPTPVGPAARDPSDPDLWDWGEDDDSRPRRHPWRAALVALLVLSLVLLLLISVV
jgi:hypothetical protein